MNIVTITYRSTSYYLLESSKRERLLIDCGWPGTLGMMIHELRRKDLAPNDIGYLLVTHFHPDHAGLVEELKGGGSTLILLDVQEPYVAKLKSYVKPADGYVPIRTDEALIVRAAESRALLERLGFAGEIVPTPGHSEDSVSLVLDTGLAFIGDLEPEWQSTPDEGATRQSWARLRALGVRMVYPAHGGPRSLD